MCGIFSLLNTDNKDITNELTIQEQFNKGKKRGPEYSKLESYMKMVLGFHRLAINGLNEQSNQPFFYKDIILICNGEIYNYKQLYKYMKIVPETDSDCEVIIHLYIKYGIEQTLNMLDGVYSFILCDNRFNKQDQSNYIYIARDPLGVRPLYKLYNVNDNNNLYNLYGFASELKTLQHFYNTNTRHYILNQFEPGTFSVFQLANKVNPYWKPFIENKKFFIPSFSHTLFTQDINELLDEFVKGISRYLNTAVIKRCNTTERPIACLLSGGLDSSLIAALVSNYFRSKGKLIKTYSIGLKNSEDVKFAAIVADYIGSDHTEIILTEEQMFDAIPEVIEAIESYDTTTVRASIGNYLIGKYIAANSETKVIFNGDGSDELFGGYLYMNKCPDDIEFDKETRRLLNDIHLFDVLRSDKSISSNGLEPRTPFLDRSFVNYVLSIPSYFRNHKNFGRQEKYILRDSFNKDNFRDSLDRQILPDKILYRTKEAFSDGVSSQGRSLYTILQEKIASELNKKTENLESSVIFKPDISTEKLYYMNIFKKYYPNCEHIVPYFWMPKYTQATDPSARTLDFY